MRVLVVGVEPALAQGLLNLGHEVLLCYEAAHAAKAEKLIPASVPRTLIRSGRSPEAILGAVSHAEWTGKIDCIVPGGELEVVACADEVPPGEWTPS